MRKAMAIVIVFGLVCGCGASMVKASRTAEEAAAALASGDNAGALALARHGIADAPGDPWLRYNEGCALAGLGRVDQALVALRAAERGFTDGYFRSLAVFRGAVALESSRRCAEAVREFRRYAALVAGSDAASAAVAATHVRACKAVLPSRPKPPVVIGAPLTPPLASRAAMAIATRNPTRGLALANQGLRTAPSDPWLLYARGVALVELDRIDEGVAALRKAERRFAEPAEQALPAFRRGLAYEQAGRCAEAARELGHYARLTGDTALAQHHMESCPGARPRSYAQAAGASKTR